MSEIITADHLNATRLGKRITINSLHGTVVSGRLKKIRADYAIMPSSTIFWVGMPGISMSGGRQV